MNTEFTVPAQGGRALRVAAGDEGRCILLGVVSTRGNLMEAVTVDRADVGAVIGALERVKEVADRDLMSALTRKQVEADERYKAALARNPHLNGTRPLGNERYIVRPR